VMPKFPILFIKKGSLFHFWKCAACKFACTSRAAAPSGNGSLQNCHSLYNELCVYNPEDCVSSPTRIIKVVSAKKAMQTYSDIQPLTIIFLIWKRLPCWKVQKQVPWAVLRQQRLTWPQNQQVVLCLPRTTMLSKVL
jgi:hypothetical protein